MPIYEYECETCRKRFEKLQKASDPPCRKCPNCDGPLRKLLSPPAIQFKGKGFYITDYAKKEPPASADKGGGQGESKGKPAAESQAEGKPAPADKSRPD
ncbi:MAG: zinc ribbon domain-containing protein [Candidatus Aminicenantes bacterium]|nr:zinc ribbon domain-containing protein [Candidatus Aminicenantes bacterium]